MAQGPTPPPLAPYPALNVLRALHVRLHPLCNVLQALSAVKEKLTAGPVVMVSLHWGINWTFNCIPRRDGGKFCKNKGAECGTSKCGIVGPVMTQCYKLLLRYVAFTLRFLQHCRAGSMSSLSGRI